MEKTNQDLKYLPIPNGETIAYREQGQGNQVLILIHGNMISSAYWSPLLPYLTTSKCRIIAIDLRGFGHSTYKKQIDTIEDFADDVYQFCQTLNIQQAIFAGWSLGGLVCMCLGYKYPQVSQQIILIASGHVAGYHVFKLDPESGTSNHLRCASKDEIGQQPRIKAIIDMQDQKEKIKLKQLFDTVLFSCGGKPKANEYDYLIEETLCQRNYLDTVTAIHFFDISCGGKNKAKDIKCPVLIYHGEKDLIIPQNMGEGNAIEIGKEKCNVIIKQNCGHMPPFDFPEDLAKEIINFITNEYK